MCFWNVYCGGIYLGRVWAYGYNSARRIARVKWGVGRAYHVTRDCEGQ